MEDQIYQLSSATVEVSSSLANVEKEIEKMKSQIIQYEEDQEGLNLVSTMLKTAERSLHKVVLGDEGNGLRVIGTGLVSGHSVDDAAIPEKLIIKKNQLLFGDYLDYFNETSQDRKNGLSGKRTKSMGDVKNVVFNQNLQSEFQESTVQESQLSHTSIIPNNSSISDILKCQSDRKIISKKKGRRGRSSNKSSSSPSSKIGNKNRKNKKKTKKNARGLKPKKLSKKKLSKKPKSAKELEQDVPPSFTKTYDYEPPMTLIGEFNKRYARETNHAEPNIEKRFDIIPKGKVGIVSVVVSDSKDIWKKDYHSTSRSITKLRNVIVKLAKKTSGSILSNFFFDSFMIVFPSFIHACEFCISLQVTSNYIPYPASLERVVGSARDEEGLLLFRGLRLKLALECGEAGEDFEVVKDKNLIFGEVVDRITNLSKRCLEGEIVFPNRYLDKILDHRKHFTERTRIVCREEYGAFLGRTFCLVPEKLFKRTVMSKQNFWFMDDSKSDGYEKKKKKKVKIKTKTEEEGEGETTEEDDDDEEEEKTIALEKYELEEILLNIWRCSTKISKINALLKLERKPNVRISPTKLSSDDSKTINAGIEYVSERQKIIDSMKENLDEEIKEDTIEYLEVIRNEAMNISLTSPYMKRPRSSHRKKKKKKKKVMAKKSTFTSTTTGKKKKKKKRKKKKKKKKKDVVPELQIRELNDQVLIHTVSPRLSGLRVQHQRPSRSTQTKHSYLEEQNFEYWQKKPMTISVGLETNPVHLFHFGTQTYEDPRIIALRDQVRDLRQELRDTKERKQFYKKKVNDNKTLLNVQRRLLCFDSNLKEKYRGMSGDLIGGEEGDNESNKST